MLYGDEITWLHRLASRDTNWVIVRLYACYTRSNPDFPDGMKNPTVIEAERKPGQWKLLNMHSVEEDADIKYNTFCNCNDAGVKLRH